MMTRPHAKGAISSHTPLTNGMTTRTRTFALATLMVAAVFVLPACSSTVSGTPVASAPAATSTEPTFPPGLSIITDTPMSGYVPPTSAEQAVQRAVTFWNGSPHRMTLRVNAQAAQPPLTCGTTQFARGRAATCEDNTVIYDPTAVQSLLNTAPNGPIAVQVIMAHEVGHAIANEYGAAGQLDGAPNVGTTAAAELSADCYSGMYMTSTMLPVADLAAALPLTALGEAPARTEAFHDGLTTTDPNVCVDRYL